MAVFTHGRRLATRALIGAATAFALSVPAWPLERLDLSVTTQDKDLRTLLRSVSALFQARDRKTVADEDVFAAARADYANFLAALYSEGYYAPVIHIRLDGREAGDIAPLDAPTDIKAVSVEVDPGPRFTFGRARMKPYAPGTKLPPAYGDTKVAKSTAIVEAADAGVEGWRQVGHPKARVSDQIIVADHPRATIDSQILLDPGPRLSFGKLTLSGYERMKPRRLAKIAGFPTGEVYDPDLVAKVENRLRKTGIFRSVALTEAETPSPDGTLDFHLAVTEELPRRYGFGAEASSLQGLSVSGYWMHRNLFGGGERLRIDGEVTEIGGQSGIVGYSLGARIDRPATPTADSSAFLAIRAEKFTVVDLTVEGVSLSFGLTRVLSDQLTAEAGVRLTDEWATYPGGRTNYRLLSLPIGVTWDSRDEPLDAHKGFYLASEVTPFLGFGTTGSGGRVTADARVYRALGSEKGTVLAGRLQIGSVFGSALTATPPEYLFYSGGGGTVRGQPYQSLGVPVTKGLLSIDYGGRSFVGLSGEVRQDITDTISAVAFADAGYISAGELFGGGGEWHSGAGLGLRYDTGIGPIRVDLAAPVSGSTGDGLQLYIGIGQAF